MLTKSLHTVTAAVNVAAHLRASRYYGSAAELAIDALAVLGYAYGTEARLLASAEVDPTVSRTLKGIEKTFFFAPPAATVTAITNVAAHLKAARDAKAIASQFYVD